MSDVVDCWECENSRDNICLFTEKEIVRHVQSRCDAYEPVHECRNCRHYHKENRVIASLEKTIEYCSKNGYKQPTKGCDRRDCWSRMDYIVGKRR